MLLAAVMMPSHLREGPAAGKIDSALKKVLSTNDLFTRDLGGTLKTTEFTQAIIRGMEAAS